MKKVAIIVSMLIQSFPLWAQTSNAKIPEEAQERLDHIVGKWAFRTDFLTRTGEVRRSVEGTEEARYLIDDRVVELTTNVSGSTSKGWLFYDTVSDEFKLTSVDARGDLWVLSGDLETYVITSQPKTQSNGRELTIRFTHENIREDSFEAIFETSIDGGKSWWTRSRQYMKRDGL